MADGSKIDPGTARVTWTHDILISQSLKDAA